MNRLTYLPGLLAASLLGSCTPATTTPPASCVPGKDFVILQAVPLTQHVKIAVVKTASRQYKLLRPAGEQCEVIHTPQPLPQNEYALDSLHTAAGLTVVSVFSSQEGEMLAQGFVFSSDYGKHFRYVDKSEVSSGISEGIERISLDAAATTVSVDLFRLEPAWHFLSMDSCRSWRVKP